MGESHIAAVTSDVLTKLLIPRIKRNNLSSFKLIFFLTRGLLETPISGMDEKLDYFATKNVVLNAKFSLHLFYISMAK